MSTAFRRMRRGLPLALAGVATGLAVVALTAPEATPAGAASGAAKTHFGASAADVVALHLDGPAAARRFARVMPDGTRQLDWRAPAGSALYVTDVEWVSGWADEQRGYDNRVLRVRVVNDAAPASSGTVMVPGFAATHFPMQATDIYDAGAARATVGFLVGAGAHLEADIPASIDADGDPQPAPHLGDVVVRGYLVRAK